MIRTFVFSASSFSKGRELIWLLARREISLRYSGSLLGSVWSFINLLGLLVVYSFVFGMVFKTRWGGVATESQDHTILLFVGMLVHGLFAECLSKAAPLIVANSKYVKKLISPLEILPWTIIGEALFHVATGSVVLCLILLVLTGSQQWTLLYLSLILVPFFLFRAGLSWFVSALGVFFRDIVQLVGMVVAVMIFLSPVFYSIEALPERFRSYMLANPLTLAIEQEWQVLIYGTLPDPQVLLILLLFGGLGLWFFKKTRNGFCHVL